MYLHRSCCHRSYHKFIGLYVFSSTPDHHDPLGLRNGISVTRTRGVISAARPHAVHFKVFIS